MLFVLFRLDIVLSVLWFMDSDYPFGIFKLLSKYYRSANHTYTYKNSVEKYWNRIIYPNHWNEYILFTYRLTDKVRHMIHIFLYITTAYKDMNMITWFIHPICSRHYINIYCKTSVISLTLFSSHWSRWIYIDMVSSACVYTYQNDQYHQTVTLATQHPLHFVCCWHSIADSVMDMLC